MDANAKIIALLINFVLSIAVAIFFSISVKKKVKTKEEFSGAMWGLANGLFGLGFLWIIIAHDSINKEIVKIRDKDYKKYAQNQMRDFVKIYVCVAMLLWLIIAPIVFQMF